MEPLSHATRLDSEVGSVASGDKTNRKRFPRSHHESETPSVAATAGVASQDLRSNIGARRRSTLRENKAPLLGPRPLELTQTKRVISDTQTVGSNGSRSYLPQFSSEPVLAQPTLKHPSNPRYSFSQNANSTTANEEEFSANFLPSVDFDGFHMSITNDTNQDRDILASDNPPFATDERPTLTQAKTTTLGERVARVRNTSGSTASNSSYKMDPKQDGGTAPPWNRPIARRVSNARRQPSQGSTNSSSMPPPNAPSAFRSRRQSTLPATGVAPMAAATATARAPRKSIGPGIVAGAYGARSSEDGNRPQTGTFAAQGSLSRSSSINKDGKQGRRGTSHAQPSAQAEGQRLTSSARAAKARSMLPTSRDTTQFLRTDATSSTTPASPSLQALKSPGKPPGLNPGTPSSGSSKRQSVHVGGLGARTISPTDARRLRRLSQMAPGTFIPDVPNTPPTPQPDLGSGSKIASPVPAMPPRKSATPSSARATPDKARQINVSGSSVLSASSSFASLRSGSVPPSARNSQILPSSRLPTPKPRNVHSSIGVAEEEVPPVPAIPKAYDSPKDQIDQPFFSELQSAASAPALRTLGKERGPSSAAIQIGTAPSAPPAATGRPVLEVHTGAGDHSLNQAQGVNQRHRRGLTVGSTGGLEPDRNTVVNTKRTTYQPNRLPPLNLLPLSTPTASRIASLPAPSAEVDHRVETPSKRVNAKTPSTPMTASKATFSRSMRDDNDNSPAVNIRSQSSAYQSTFGASLFSTGPSPDLMLRPGATGETNNDRHMMTPFSSGSLPKESGDFHYYMHQKGEAPHSAVARVAQDVGLSDRTKQSEADQSHQSRHVLQDSRATHDKLSTSGDTDSEITTGGGLRRKLSLGWKRTASKASNKRQDDDNSKPQQLNDMPPPKIPASAIRNTTAASPTPSTQSTRQSSDSRRRKSSVTTLRSSLDIDRGNGSAENGQPRVAQKVSRVGTNPPPPYEEANRAVSANAARVQPRSSSSLLSPMHRMLGSRNSVSALKARNLDTNLDKDDLAADKVMEKLASKRKDFETAAKDVDELRKRAHPKERVTPAQALQMVELNIFERGEIIDYREIYFCGTKHAKKHVGDLKSASGMNFGYDDERGDYNICLGDHLAYRYEVVDVLGKGSFGQVVRCVDHKNGNLVAVKIIRNKKRFHQQALVEVNILQKLREWDPDNKHSMINFTHSFYFRGHLCISTELLGMNLYEFIKAYEFKGFPLVLIRRFAKQILSSLVLLKSRRVIHCDLKPENILLAHPLHSEIKVIDFGSSCFENEKVYTYIQSRFYRSPEVILGMSYGIQIDMWSLGCILAELLTGYPIFPGENEQEQLACIMEIFGPPEKHLIEKSSRKKLFFDSLGKPRVTVSSKGRRRRPSSKTLQQALKCDDDAFLDFIARCLRWDPERRIRPEDAVQHDFITGFRRPAQYGPGMRARVAQPANVHPHAGVAATGAMAAASPAKRAGPTGQAQSSGPGTRVRPLPEPPASTIRNGTSTNAANPAASPNKGGPHPPRRHSTMNSATNVDARKGSGTVNSGVGSTVGTGPQSGLPRGAGTRSISHGNMGSAPQSHATRGGDMASAAALASLRAR